MGPDSSFLRKKVKKRTREIEVCRSSERQRGFQTFITTGEDSGRRTKIKVRIKAMAIRGDRSSSRNKKAYPQISFYRREEKGVSLQEKKIFQLHNVGGGGKKKN